MEIPQSHGRHLDTGLQGQQSPVLRCRIRGEKEHAALAADQHLQRAIGRSKPQLQLYTAGGVPPLPGEQEALALHPG